MAFVAANKEACSKYHKSPKGKATRAVWYAKNKDQQKARVKAWTDTHQDELKEWRKEYYKANKVKLSIRATKAGAKRRGLDYLLPDALAEDLMTDACFYCGNAEEVNGIDRVDNFKGYLEDNVVTACKWCNRAKHVRTRAEFETWAHRLVANLSGSQLKAA